MTTQKRSRRMQITCNNPLEKGLHAEKIKEIMTRWKTEYYCFCYETGEEGTHHFHLYVKFQHPQGLNTVSKAFANAHIEITRYGSSKQNRDYIRKEGAYIDSEKKTTNHIETFFESGECPTEEVETQGRRSDLETMMTMVEDGASDLEILKAVPSLVAKLSIIEQYRQAFWEEKGKEYRKMKVWYIYGKTRTGKTSYVYQNHDTEEIFSVLDYEGNGIWDGYNTAKTRVVLLDEFRSSLTFSLLLAITDGQPLTLNARYKNRICLHDTVYIVSNKPLKDQYPKIQEEEPDSWKAFLARIENVRYYYSLGKYIDMTVEEYIRAEDDPKSNLGFHESDEGRVIFPEPNGAEENYMVVDYDQIDLPLDF